MDPSPSATYTPHNSEKSLFTGSGSGSGGVSASMEEVEVQFPTPTSFVESQSAEEKQVICPEVTDVNKDGNAEDLFFHNVIEEKFIKNGKEKISVPSYLSDTDVAPSDMVHTSEGFGPLPHNWTLGDLSSHDMEFSEDDMIDDEFAMLQAHFDSLDISPEEEAAIPWWQPPEGGETQGLSASSSAFISPTSFSNTGDSKTEDSQSSMTFTELLQAQFDSSDISPEEEEAAIPWWQPPEGGETQGLSASGSAFISPTSFSNAGDSKTKDSQSSMTYTGTSQTGVHSSKSIWEPFPVSFPGKKPYHGPGKLASHIHKKLGTWHSASGAEAGGLFPSGTPYPPNPVNIKMFQLSKTSSGVNNHFPGWKVQEGAGELNFPAVDLTPHNFTGGFTGGFSYMQDPSVVLDQGIASEISVPSDLASCDQDGSEVLIVKRLETFKKFDTVQDHSDHHYSSKNQSRPPKDWVKKIQEEWRILENDLPDTISVRVYETRMDLLRAAIIGADGTPYHDGIFFFDLHFPMAYPTVPPLVYYRSGGLRLNPNLYNSGKVCLSLLNTWSGDGNEKWIPGVSTVLQVLVSIQGLILNAEPYFNEPGYEGSAGTPDGEKWSRRYSENAFLLSLKTMLYSMRQPPKHFEDLVYRHFYKRGHDILAACKAYLDGAQVGTLVKGGIQDVAEGDKKACCNTYKMNLPAYINALVKAFTKIGVVDCEKYAVPEKKNDNVASKKTAPDGFEFKPLQKPPDGFELKPQETPAGFEFKPHQTIEHVDGEGLT